MAKKYVIHPAIGVARVGNSRDEFFLAPNQIGGLPTEYNGDGTEGQPVTTFKDGDGKIKRQGEKFCVYEYDDTLGSNQTPKKLVLGSAGANELSVQSIK